MRKLAMLIFFKSKQRILIFRLPQVAHRKEIQDRQSYFHRAWFLPKTWTGRYGPTRATCARRTIGASSKNRMPSSAPPTLVPKCRDLPIGRQKSRCMNPNSARERHADLGERMYSLQDQESRQVLYAVDAPTKPGARDSTAVSNSIRQSSQANTPLL